MTNVTRTVLWWGRFDPDYSRNRRAKHLLFSEQRLLQGADIVLADTPEHARFFADTLGVKRAKLHVVYVGAEEPLFYPAPAHAPGAPVEVLFYGSFIPLQGPGVIVDAARRYQGPEVRWVLLGNGPLLENCMRDAHGLVNVVFENWLPYTQLPERIRRADILLGVFGATPKAQRVIPNKVFQALACGKPLITCHAPAYPKTLRDAADSGIHWVPPYDATALAGAVAALAAHPERLGPLGAEARRSYERHFSAQALMAQLREALSGLR
jgi:glycosyltransferase involved in cell wall biosynthesis